MSEVQPYPDVIQVQEHENPNDVNKMLEVGWILLRTRNIRVGAAGEISELGLRVKQQYTSLAGRVLRGQLLILWAKL